MICPKCGSNVKSSSHYCNNCGFNLDSVFDGKTEYQYREEKQVENNYSNTTNENKKNPYCFDVFAKLSYTFGILSLLIPYVGACFLGIPGIVFGALGKRSHEYSYKAHKGLVMSTIGTILFFIVYMASMIYLIFFYYI